MRHEAERLEQFAPLRIVLVGRRVQRTTLRQLVIRLAEDEAATVWARPPLHVATLARRQGRLCQAAER